MRMSKMARKVTQAEVSIAEWLSFSKGATRRLLLLPAALRMVMKAMRHALDGAALVREPGK
jgi:hypothetical protein